MKILNPLKFLFICLIALAVMSCSKKEERELVPVQPVPPQDCILLQFNFNNTFNNTFYTYNSKKLKEMRRSRYYYQFTYNSQGKISDSKVFLVEIGKPVSTQKPDTLAPFDRYFWEGDRLVKKNLLKQDGTLRIEYLNTFDSQGRLTAVKLLIPNVASVTDYLYEYDSNGRLIKRTERLTGRRNNKDYTNEVVNIEFYEYGNSPAKHPESLLKDSGLPYDIFGDDPWREWVASKIIRQTFNFESGKLESPIETKVSVTKTNIDNIATEITTEQMLVITLGQPPELSKNTEIYTINLTCK